MEYLRRKTKQNCDLFVEQCDFLSFHNCSLQLRKRNKLGKFILTNVLANILYFDDTEKKDNVEKTQFGSRTNKKAIIKFYLKASNSLAD